MNKPVWSLYLTILLQTHCANSWVKYFGAKPEKMDFEKCKYVYGVRYVLSTPIWYTTRLNYASCYPRFPNLDLTTITDTQCKFLDKNPLELNQRKWISRSVRVHNKIISPNTACVFNFEKIMKFLKPGGKKYKITLGWSFFFFFN